MKKEQQSGDFDKPILERAICEIRYVPTLSFHSTNITGLCETFVEDMPHWRISTAQLGLADHVQANRAHKELTVTNAKFWFRNRFPGPYENFTAKAEKYARRWLQGLGISQSTRMGVRVYYVIPTERSFEDVRNIVFSVFCKSDITSRLSVQLSDFLVNFQFSSEEEKYNYAVTPLKSGQFPENEPPPEGENLPEKTSVFLDIDRYVENQEVKGLHVILNEAKKSIENILNSSITLMKG